MYRKPLTCSQCEHRIQDGEQYAVILGEVHCFENGCADDWMKDELEEQYKKYRDQIAEMLCIPVLQGGERIC